MTRLAGVRIPLRRKHARARLWPLYAAGLALFAWATPTPSSVGLGTGLAAAGLALRAWGAGHLVKSESLAVSGPYAHLRHPLYAGALLLGLGLGAAAGAWGLAAVAGLGLPVFLVYYLPYKDRIESARLERRFGEPYARYRAEVPALLPCFAAWSPPAELRPEATRRWSPERFRANHELGTILAAVAALALLALRPLVPL